MAKQQMQLFEYFDTTQTRKRYGRTTHGGTRAQGHRKLERPLSSKKWIHLVLKSDRAKGAYSFLLPKNKLFIEQTLAQKGRKFGVKVADFANVGNHLHLKIKIASRANFQKFLKSVAALIARHVTGARKGRPFGRFWQGLAFTRVLTSALEILNLRGYVAANRTEARHGIIARQAFLSQFNRWVYRERLRTKSMRAIVDGLLPLRHH